MSHLQALTAWVWQPLAPPALLVALLAVLMALAVLAYRRSLRQHWRGGALLLAMRLLGLAAVVVLLLNPILAGTPVALDHFRLWSIVLDTSASMRVRDVQGVSRAAAARKWLETTAAIAEATPGPRFYALDQRLSLLPTTQPTADADALAHGRASRLIQGLEGLVRDAGMAGSQVLLLSDGRDTSAASWASLAVEARRNHVVIHAVCFGQSAMPVQWRRLAMVALPQPSWLYVGQTGQIVVELKQVGLNGTAGRLQVHAGQEHWERRIEFGPQAAVEVIVPIRPRRAGSALYQVDFILDAGPTSAALGDAAQLRQAVALDVSYQPIRVLLLEARPFWDTRFLALALRADPGIELDQILSLSPQREVAIPGADNSEPALPRSASAWSHYDCVILGQGMQDMLDARAGRQLTDYVTSGGHMIFARGRPYDPATSAGRELAQPLALIEPVHWAEPAQGPWRLELTPTGRAIGLLRSSAHAYETQLSTWPGFSALPALGQPKTATSVLFQARASDGGDAVAALATMPFGSGSVAGVMGEGLWRWRMGPFARASEGSSAAYDLLWSNLVRWLVQGGEFAPGEDIALTLSPPTAAVDEQVALTLVDRGGTILQAPKLETLDPQGRKQVVNLEAQPTPGMGLPRRWTGTYRPSQEGVHRLRLANRGDVPELEKVLAAYEPQVEDADVSANPADLEALAQATGGRFLRGTQQARWENLISQGETPRLAYPIPDDPPGLSGWVLAVLLAWMGGEWLARRRWGWL